MAEAVDVAASQARAFDEFEIAGWRGLGEQYHSRLGPLTSRAADALVTATGAEAPERLLDLGTGPGYVAAVAAERGVDVVACDVSAAMLSLAATLYPHLGIRFEVADARELPYAAETFDVVTAGFLLLHSAQPELIVAEAARVLRPGGWFAASVYDVPSRARFAGIFAEALADAPLAPPAMPPGPGLFELSAAARLEQLFTEAGLTGMRVDRLELIHAVQSAHALYQTFAQSTVRAAAILAAQRADVTEQIVAALAKHLEPYKQPDGYQVPVSFLVASGHRPANLREQP
jgi:SAM-dependent methyltransferase